MIPENITLLEQRRFLRGRQKLEILSEGSLEITYKRLLIHRQFQVPLFQILTPPERIKHYSIGYLVGMSFFLFLCGLTVMGGIDGGDFVLYLGLGCLFLCLFSIAFACIWKFQSESINALVYHLREGGQIHIWFEKPNVKAFHTFCETLTKKAQEAWQNQPVNPSQQSLAGEIVALKKLKDDGILSRADFERAKEKLINSVTERKIGFQ